MITLNSLITPPTPPQLFLFPPYSNQKSRSLLETSSVTLSALFQTLPIFFPLLKTTARDLFPSGQVDTEPWNMKMPWVVLQSPLWIVQCVFPYPGVAPVSASKSPPQVRKIQLEYPNPTDSSRDGQETERWCYRASGYWSTHCPFELWQTSLIFLLLQKGLYSHQILSPTHAKDPATNTFPVTLQGCSALFSQDVTPLCTWNAPQGAAQMSRAHPMSYRPPEPQQLLTGTAQAAELPGSEQSSCFVSAPSIPSLCAQEAATFH